MSAIKSTHDLRNSLNTLTMHAELGKMLTNALTSEESKSDLLESFDVILAMSKKAADQIDGYDLIAKGTPLEQD